MTPAMIAGGWGDVASGIERDILSILPPLSALNAWCRVPYEEALGMTDCRSAIYAMKNRTVRKALDLGLATMRIVAVERPCKACKGSGTYIWQDWNDEDHQEYQDCRRCGATGKVILRFAETAIAGTKFHTPRPKADFLDIPPARWESPEPTEWLPEQPGRIMTHPELIRTLNLTEGIFAGSRMIRWDNGPWRNPFAYHLNLGEVPWCFVCGRHARPEPGYGYIHFQEIYRPGLKWRQFVCDRSTSCPERAMRFPRQWPANLFPEGRAGRWEHDYPAWYSRCPTPSLAEAEYVCEWLARRGIVDGAIPPGEYGFWGGEFVEVAAVRNGHAWVRGTGWLHQGYGQDAPLLRIPSGELRGYPQKLICSG